MYRVCLVEILKTVKRYYTNAVSPSVGDENPITRRTMVRINPVLFTPPFVERRTRYMDANQVRRINVPVVLAVPLVERKVDYQ
jgi:hypothetical protein